MAGADITGPASVINGDTIEIAGEHIHRLAAAHLYRGWGVRALVRADHTLSHGHLSPSQRLWNSPLLSISISSHVLITIDYPPFPPCFRTLADQWPTPGGPMFIRKLRCHMGFEVFRRVSLLWS